MDALTISVKEPIRLRSRVGRRRDAAQTEVSDHEIGLTLIEMIVVLAIIALVAALIVPSVIGRPDQARVTVAQADMKSIGAALKIYRLDNGAYPTTEQGLAALAIRPSTAPVPTTYPADAYLPQTPTDPWGHPYVYRTPGTGGAGFDLMSLGRDGKPGGDGVDADLHDSGH